MKTPVVVLVFNRPALTARLIERLALVRPQRLLIVADGARPDKSGEPDKVAAVRRLFDELPWDCEITRDFSPVNLGCARRVSSGISWAFEQVEEAIILEDDCLPNASFFRFCAELLERYRTDTRIASISGTDFTLGFPRPVESYFFSRYNLFWGWATWRRAWEHYDHAMTPIANGNLDRVLRDAFPEWRARFYWRMVLRRVYDGRLNSWGYRWLLSCWRAGMLGIQPSVSMVDNTGMGADSTHTTHDIYGTRSARELEEAFVHPKSVVRDSRRDQVIEDRIYSRSLWVRSRWIVRKIGLNRLSPNRPG